MSTDNINAIKLALEIGFSQGSKGKTVEDAYQELQQRLSGEIKGGDTDETIVRKCPCCDANMKMHWHAISKGLANALVKFRKKVIELNRNKVHTKDEIGFTKSEFTNFQKLRYHGLVAKYKNPETDLHEAGYWILTSRGNAFCKNLLAIPQRVQTFRNKISDKSDKMVTLSDVLKGVDVPYWEQKDDFGFDFADVNDLPEFKFGENGQGFLFS